MYESILRHANQIIRSSRPAYLSGEVCSEHYAAKSLEIAFLSKRCCNDAKGSCIMCDYGYSNVSYSDDEYINEMKTIIKKYLEIDSILLCTNGSILDEHQISNELFKKILETVADSNIKEIQIETHYINITPAKLDLIKTICKNKIITLELGFETINELCQEKLIMKNINIEKFEQTIFLIQSYGFNTILNIMFGLPFLSTKEQILDTHNTVQWGFSHNCRVVIFPLNIKPYTLLSHMYKSGFYHPISYWSLIYLLDMFNDEDLTKITIAWYGDREEGDPLTDERAIFPMCCDECFAKLMDFCRKFDENRDNEFRKMLLEKIKAEANGCSCNDEFIDKLKNDENNNFKIKYQQYTKRLKNDFSL